MERKSDRTLAQAFFAEGWPLRVLLAAGSGAGVVAGLRVSEISPSSLLRWPDVLWVLAVAVVSAAVGFFAMVVIAGIVLPPVYRVRVWLNGGPFRVGDRVRILCGPHRARVAMVYEVWEEGRRVRVDLGEEAAGRVRDVFGGDQLQREDDRDV